MVIEFISNVAHLLYIFIGEDSRMNLFKGRVDGMTWNAQETDLMRGPITRTMARKIEEENKGKVAMFNRNFQELA